MNEATILNNKHSPDWSGFQTAAIPLIILTVLTLLAFANAWPNSLVLDDKAFAGPERPQDLDSLFYIFTHDVWSALGIESGFYRPLLLLGLSLETWVFGDWLAGYHLSNIFQHLLVTYVAYGFFRQLLNVNTKQSASSDWYALLAALVFAVHPIHTEAVDSIFNRSEIMVALFGLAGLWWLLRYLESQPIRAWAGLAIAYFLALLSKENAAVIPGLAVVFVLPLTGGDLMTRMRKCLPVLWLLLPLAVYLAMRAYALGQPGLGTVSPVSEGEEIVTLLDGITSTGLGTFLSFAGVLGLSIKVLVWPYPMHLYYEGISTPESAWYLALNLLLIIAALVQLRRKHYGLAAGLAFFYIAMLPASRVFDLLGNGPHLAERYLYFPSIGLAIILAFAFRALTQRFGLRVVVNGTLPLLLLMTFLTWDRNADWASDISLYETEYQRGDRDSNILRLLTSTHVLARNYARVVKICDENQDKQEEFFKISFVYYCAVAYEHRQRFKEAERAYLLQIEHPPIRIEASLALAHFYIRQKRRYDAEKYFLAAVDWSDDPADKAMYMGEMILSLNPASREQAVIARNYIQEALRLRPGWSKAATMLEGLDNALNSARAKPATEPSPDPE